MRYVFCLLFALTVIASISLIGCGDKTPMQQEPGSTLVGGEKGASENEEASDTAEDTTGNEDSGDVTDASPIGTINRCIAAVESGDLPTALTCFSEGIQDDYLSYGYYYDFDTMLDEFEIEFNDVKLSLSSQQGQNAKVLVTGGSVTVTGPGFERTVELVDTNGPESIFLVMNNDGTWGITSASDGLDDVAMEILDEMEAYLFE